MRHQLDPETVGPVDVAVIGFSGDRPHDDVAPALAELEDRGTIRVIDLALISRDPDGSTEWVEIEDAQVAEALAALDDPEQDLLNDEDLQLMAEALEPGESAMVVVWEHCWASRLAKAVRDGGGELIAQDRIPHEVVVGAVQALSD